MPHSLNCTCYICYICYICYNIVIAGEKKLCSKMGHRLRPPAGDVLDVHGGLRCQQLLGDRHAAAACCVVQRSGTTSAPAEWRPAAPRLRDRRSLSSSRLGFRTSTAAPFATRNATIAGWPYRAAWCSAAAPSKSRSRLPPQFGSTALPLVATK